MCCIGELNKLEMLTARIMHECVKKLLKTNDEESLECPCRLLTTVGQVRFAALTNRICSSIKSYLQVLET